MTSPLPRVTWAALLAHYTQIAQASAALPRTPAGDRWRAAIPSLITLSAVAAALGDLAALPESERALSLTKGDLLIRSSAKTLHDLWRAEPLPDDVQGLIDDARASAAAARREGLLWVVQPAESGEPGMIDAPSWDDVLRPLHAHADRVGLLLLPARNETVLSGEPCAFVRGRFGGPPPPEVLAVLIEIVGAPPLTSGPVQIYRQIHAESGGVARDVIVPLDHSLPPGKPLLLPAIEDGQVRPEPAPSRSRRAQWQSFGPWRVEQPPAQEPRG